MVDLSPHDDVAELGEWGVCEWYCADLFQPTAPPQRTPPTARSASPKLAQSCTTEHRVETLNDNPRLQSRRSQRGVMAPALPSEHPILHLGPHGLENVEDKGIPIRIVGV